MSNKTNIEEDIEVVNIMIDNSNNIMSDLRECEVRALKNILTDRERLIEENEMLEENYKLLIENVSYIAKELNLEEDATIDEIYTAIRILKSKRINMFEQLDCIDKANKYDSLVEKIKDKIIQRQFELQQEYKEFENDIKLNTLQELLDTEKE